MLIPAKTFEYLRSGRLIVALTTETSATARLVREFGGCLVADPEDVGAIARQLAQAYSTWASGTRGVDRAEECLGRYSRRSAAAALCQVLDPVVEYRVWPAPR